MLEGKDSMKSADENLQEAVSCSESREMRLDSSEEIVSLRDEARIQTEKLLELDELEKILELSVEDKIALAENPKTSGEILSILSHDLDEEVLVSVVENPSTPAYIVRGLSLHLSILVREAVAKSLKISFEILVKLLDDSERKVRRNAIENPLITPEMLNKLSHDRSGQRILLAIIRHPLITVEILEKLRNSGYEQVKSVAMLALESFS